MKCKRSGMIRRHDRKSISKENGRTYWWVTIMGNLVSGFAISILNIFNIFK
jgi:hypothetical protein